MIKIKSKKEGFRRCGIAHPATVVEHPDNKFTSEQLVILQAEPMLIVEVGLGHIAMTPDPPPAPVFSPVIPAEAGIQADVVAAAPADVKPKGKGKK